MKVWCLKDKNTGVLESDRINNKGIWFYNSRSVARAVNKILLYRCKPVKCELIIKEVA